MQLVIVGSGNVATVFGKRLKAAGHQVVQVLSRTPAHAKALGEQLGCDYISDAALINKDADAYLLAVNDSVLYGLDQLSPIGTKLVVHTAGSVPMDVLQKVSVNYGVMYPLQSLRKEMETTEDIPLLINGNTENNTAIIKTLAETISGKVSIASDEERLKLHVAAVVVSNFTNHLYALAQSFCETEKVDFNMLLPLIKETAGRVEHHAAKDLQTGPAIRNDVFTLDRHLRLLAAHPQLKYVYLKLTDSILNR